MKATKKTATLAVLFTLASTPASAGWQDTLGSIFDPLGSPPSPTIPEPPEKGLLNRVGWKAVYDRAKDAAKRGGIKTPYTGDAIIKPKLLDGGSGAMVTFEIGL